MDVIVALLSPVNALYCRVSIKDKATSWMVECRVVVPDTVPGWLSRHLLMELSLIASATPIPLLVYLTSHSRVSHWASPLGELQLCNS